ncbi:hypothetical protein NITMOv2_4402 [Nitrospira moscoviensis]|uniref:Uncharacterized protein n=1 Tax=Nitrospira moscoviensis TaxID=42253 RepID=A0A0K2GJG9_NITMO|nr:hypothetical protein NITMOv2_4402 [Nitrospira moscoviensis]
MPFSGEEKAPGDRHGCAGLRRAGLAECDGAPSPTPAARPLVAHRMRHDGAPQARVIRRTFDPFRNCEGGS